MRRPTAFSLPVLPLLALLAPALLLSLAACGDDDGSAGTSGGDGSSDGSSGGGGTIAVRLEPTEGIFIEGFEVGLRFTAAASGEEIDRVLWSEFVAALGSQELDAYYDSVLEQAVPAGVVRVGVEVNVGMGPGPEPPDLDAASMPCELDVEVAEGETVRLEVAFDDTTDDCLRVVD